MASTLPLPRLEACTCEAIPLLTDDLIARQLGVRIAFTGRPGGASQGAYASLNLGSHVDDDLETVYGNRQTLARALGIESLPLVVPLQVHGTNLITISDADSASVHAAMEQAESGADGIIIDTPDVAALLCFADCVPVIIVSPTGRFAVVHAGWRGVEASIAPLAVQQMAQDDDVDPSSFNVYIGPHIRRECFECDPDVHRRFTEKFGDSCAYGPSHIDLTQALITDLLHAGVDETRIADSGICTVCNADQYFSFRASGGVCGRQGALAFRRETTA